MSPMPYIFKNEAELLAKLQSKKLREAVDEYYSHNIDLEHIIKWQVSSNTYRAFKKSATGVGPSVVLREWMRQFISDCFPKIAKIKDQTEYDTFVDISTKHLCKYWKHKMRYDVGYGRAAKLLNLEMKVLPVYDGFPLTKAQKDRLISHLHVPLDSFTIRALINIADFKIPTNASMGLIIDKKVYSKFQELIRTLTNKAKVPAIYFDTLAWDLSH